MSQPDAKDPLLLDHEYDGILEYDNPLPRWWLWIFYATIIFSVLYLLNVPGVGIGRGMIADYEAEMTAAEAQRAALAALRPALTEDALLAMAGQDSVVEMGRLTYAQMCASCHGADGGGVIGPNLTDDAWLHGGTAMAIHTVVAEGVLAKGMPAWGTMLAPEQVDAVVAYVLTLRGTTPANPKAPEGVVGGDTTATADSSAVAVPSGENR